ncbi:MAG TPA: Lrp/AsnC ligand binding domain-containing protein [Nitrososphaera sp.]
MDRVTELASLSKNQAYILVKCEPGFEGQVVNVLKKTKGVVKVDQVYGSPYDIVVKIKCGTLKELNSAVWRIRRINSIRFTQTLLVGEFA